MLAENQTPLLQGRIDGRWLPVNPLRLEPGDVVRMLNGHGELLQDGAGGTVFQISDVRFACVPLSVSGVEGRA